MSAQTLLASLQRLGATLALDDEGLVVRAPRGVLTVPLKEELEAHREALMALMRQAPGRVEAGGDQAAPRPNVSGGAAQRVDVDVVRRPEGLARFAEAAEQAGTLALAVTYADASVDPMLTRPSHVQIALPDGTAAVVDLDAAGGLGPLAPVLSKCSVLGHDLQPILVTLAARFDVRPRAAWDVLTAARVLEGGLNRDDARRFTLHGMAEMYLKAGVLPALSEPVSEGAPPSTQALVARVTSLFPLRVALAKHLAHENLNSIGALEFACIPAVAEMALRGVGVDAEAWHGLVARREAEREELSTTLRRELGVSDLRNGSAVLAAFLKRGLPVCSLGKDQLVPLRRDPSVERFLRWRSMDAFLRDLGPSVGSALCKYDDGRVRPHWDPMGTATGRFTCEGPNLQGLEGSPEVRGCVRPAEGSVFVVADYAQLDLRVLAEVTKDPVLLQALRSGGDLHRQTAAALLGKSSDAVTDEERRSVKPVNFSIPYGAGAEGIAATAREQFGIPMTTDEAAEHLRRYLAVHTGVARWQENVRSYRASRVRTQLGRWIGFPKRADLCDRLCAPIQGSAADGFKFALAVLHRRLPDFGAQVVMGVHDEFVVEVPSDRAREVEAVVREVMVASMRGVIPSVPVVVEVDVRRTWAKGSQIITGAEASQ